jgi:Protein of unknown function (DUF1559)
VHSICRLAVAVVLVGVAVGCERQTKITPSGPTGPIDITNSVPLPLKTPKPLNVSFIPTEAVVALALDPHQLFAAQNFKIFANTLLARQIQAGTGYEPAKLEQVMIIGGLGKKLGEFFVGGVVRFKKPEDQQQLRQAISPEWEEVADGDRKYFRPVEGGRCLFFADDRTVVTADEETLKKMLAAPTDAESPLLTTLRKSDDAAGALLVVEMALIRPQIMTYLLFSKLPAPFDKPPFDAVKEVPKNIDEAIVKFDITPVTGITMDFLAKDQEGAIATEALILNVVEKIGESVDEMVANVDPAGGMASTGPAMVLSEMFDGFKSHFTHKQEGQQLRLTYVGIPLQNQIYSLGSMLIAPVPKMIFDAEQQTSRDQLVKIGAALDAAAAAQGAYPAPAILSADGTPLLSWRVHLLPFLGEEKLYKEFHLDEPWDSEHNKTLIARMPRVYRTPGQPFDGNTYYLIPTGAGTVFEESEGPKPGSITDPKGATILVVETFDQRGAPWTKPADLKFDRADPGANITHLAKMKFQALFADGTAKVVDQKKHPNLLPFFSPAGGEEVPEGF